MHHSASRPFRFWLTWAVSIAAAALVACSDISSHPAATKPAPAPAATAPAQPPEPTPAPIAPVTQEPAPALAPPAQKPYATVALLLPLTGTAAGTGTALFNAAQLALFELADKNFTLLPYDTKGTPEGAAAAARQALANGPDIVLGPLFSGEVKTAAPLARAAHVPMLTFSADRTVAGDGVYVMGFLPGPQALRVAAFAARQGKTRLAILAPANEYGQRVAEEVANGAGGRGIAVTGVQYYDESSADIAQPLKRLAHLGASSSGDVGFDALLLPDEGARLRSIAASLPLLGVDPSKIKLLGTMLWADANADSEPALAGGWFPAPAGTAHAAFDDRYAKAFGQKPPRIASLAYDATALAAVLSRKTPRDFGASALGNPSGFAGVDGLFRLLPDGTADRGYAIDEVVKGGPPREIDAAPTSFAGPGS